MTIERGKLNDNFNLGSLGSTKNKIVVQLNNGETGLVNKNVSF